MKYKRPNPKSFSHLIAKPKAKELPDKVDLPPNSNRNNDCKYSLMPQAETYAKGVAALRDACAKDSNCHQMHIFKKGSGGKIFRTSTIYRPLTFRETIEARVNDYNTLQYPDGTTRSLSERLLLLNTPLSTCSGIVFKANSTKFKIINTCEKLVTLNAGFNKDCIEIDVPYDFIDGIELDSSNGKYGAHCLESKQAVLNHEGWLAVVEDDKVLLGEYVDLVKSRVENYKMQFSMGLIIEQDSLFNLGLGSISRVTSIQTYDGLLADANFIFTYSDETILRRRFDKIQEELPSGAAQIFAEARRKLASMRKKRPKIA